MIAITRFASLSGKRVVSQSRFLNPIRSMSVTALEDLDAVEKFSESNDKSILYFTATWCPPCKAIKPIYSELSDIHDKDGIAFGKVDVDEAADAAAEHGINSVPTFIFFNKKVPMKRFSGADRSQLETLIEELKANDSSSS
mmetsp:Transcript_18153/g.20952  ORF Transcript_18153/g.20952 Transcript_18153/m.20952 type:complete len:141 (+) Transcript_18153:132-554(+)